MEPPDTLEKGVRFGCGFLLGCFAAVASGMVYLWQAHYIVAGCVLSGVLCGFAAMKFGDGFWIWLSKGWWWW